MSVFRFLVCLPLATMTLLSAAAECGDKLQQKGKQMLLNEGYAVAFVPSVWPITVGKHFSLSIQICSPTGKTTPSTVQVNADMPIHKHGMNYRPTVIDLGGGSYRADGLMFHMPGKWRFLIELGNESQNIQLLRELDVL